MTWASTIAGQSGRCAICEDSIDPGDEIVVIDDRWVHVECAEREMDEDER